PSPPAPTPSLRLRRFDRTSVRSHFSPISLPSIAFNRSDGAGARGVGFSFRGRRGPLLAVRGEVARPEASDDGRSAGHPRSVPRKGNPTPRKPATRSPRALVREPAHADVHHQP